MGLSIGDYLHAVNSQSQTVSVPSRGNGVIDEPLSWSSLWVGSFDSFRPLAGHGGYRSYALALKNGQPAYRLPSPLGDMGLSIRTRLESGYYRQTRFPSPLGEMGLSIINYMADISPRKRVSVPSRGNGVIDSQQAGTIAAVFENVSVPSRGNGVIDFSPHLPHNQSP